MGQLREEEAYHKLISNPSSAWVPAHNVAAFSLSYNDTITANATSGCMQEDDGEHGADSAPPAAQRQGGVPLPHPTATLPRLTVVQQGSPRPTQTQGPEGRHSHRVRIIRSIITATTYM